MFASSDTQAWGCLLYNLLLRGHLLKYWAGSSLLNFSDLIGIVFSITRPERE